MCVTSHLEMSNKPHHCKNNGETVNKDQVNGRILGNMNLFRIACLLLFQTVCRNVAIAEVNASIDKPEVLSEDVLQDEHLDLESINGRDFRNNITKDISGKPWLDDLDERHIIHCVRPAKCQKLKNHTTCFGGKIPYKFTSIELTEEGSQEQSIKKLKQLEALRNVPKCWAVIQPFLCAVYLPRCTKSNGKEYVYLPSNEMCKLTMKPCRILYDTDFFPNYLKCDEKVFPCNNCSNDVRGMKFTTPSQCMSPLIPTDSELNYHKGIEGCGLQCKDPMYTNDEHESVQKLIFWGTVLCLLCNLFVIATFLIHDWKHSKHPAWNLFYISICFLFNWFGWMLQFIPGHRENIVCRRDGTLRLSEPSAGDNLACIIPFILIYYFLIAANVWFAIFTYAWYLQTKDRGNIRDRIDKEGFYFHFIAWALPFVLTVTIMVLSEVDGNSITGICFVGHRHREIRSGLVLLPVGIMTFCFSVFFAFKGGFNLNRIRQNTNSVEESKKLSSHILGMGIRTMLVVFFVLVFFIFETYDVRNADTWSQSLNDLIVCNIKENYSGDVSECKMQSRPSVAVLQLRLLCLFCINLVVSSWCWTTPALKTWKRFIMKKIGFEPSEDEKITKPKHRIIADAYAKRMDDVISVSIEKTHTDPAGLNFDVNNLNLAQSDAMSATLTNYLSKIINRRNGVTMETMEQDASHMPEYTNEGDYSNSGVSVSVVHHVVKTRRSSVDSLVSQVSQVSVKMSKTKIKSKDKHANSKSKRQRNYLYSKRTTNRRASSSSVESQQITNQMVQYNHRNNRIQVSANTVGRQIERRSAITAHNDVNAMKQFFNSRKLTSDEEQSLDESQPMNVSDEPSNMLELYEHRRNEEIYEGNEMTALELIKTFLQNSSEKELKNLLRTSYEYSNERNARSSKLHNKYPQQSKNDQFSMKNDDEFDSSGDSSIDESKNQLNASQNSKESCDIAIQADDYDIFPNGKQYRGEFDKDNFTEKRQPNYHHHEDGDFEMHQLLPKNKKRAPTIVRKNDIKCLSEAERLEKTKKLLMP